jgi:MFS family permease
MDVTHAGMPGLLTRERTIAGPHFNRWLVPPAALAIHLCIGMVYGLSVFWLPLSQAVGLSHPQACPAGTSLLYRLTATGCDWKIADLSWIFTIGIVFLGASAAIWGSWLERAGPRKAGLVAALCWPGGWALGALGIATHQLWIMWLGMSVVGGVGLGLGYISPVSTLIKWFPDKRGMATGMAIMGFGGGAMIGAPLAARLMAHFHTATDVGAASTFLVFAAIYFVFMCGGALAYRVPPDNFAPAGWTRPQGSAGTAASASVALEHAHRTPQFWLIWGVLCLNVSAGIGVLDMASPMLQDVFGGSLIGAPGVSVTQLTADQHRQVAAVAAGFAGFLSLLNILGRFFWAALSDRIGRKTTYATIFLLGIALYASVPILPALGGTALFALAFGIILSMYGGGFATVPAYLADVFGTGFVGAIHGRLLTAWSAAGVIGPVLITYIRQAQIDSGVARQNVYDRSMYILALLLVAGFFCNLFIRPVHSRWFTHTSDAPVLPTGAPAIRGISGGTSAASVVMPIAWLAVGIPLAWGFYMTIIKASTLFG